MCQDCGMGTAVGIGIVLLVLVCAMIQRVVGLGLGMIMAPFAVIMIGAHEGVMLVNFLGGATPLLMLPRIWRDIEWRKVAWIGLAAVAIMPAAAWVSVISPSGPLYVVVAVLVLISVIVSVVLNRIQAVVGDDSRTAQVLTGIGAGAGTVLGGVGGPAVTVYAVLSRWSILKMVATLQPLWILISFVSFFSKWAMDDGQMPDLAWWVWAACLVAIGAGLALGESVQHRVSEDAMRRFVIGLALLGSLLALFTGVRQMLG